MSNEATNEVTTVPNALSILNNEQTTNEQEVLNQQLTQLNYLPTLAIAAGSSQAVKDRIAFPGDFVLGGKAKLGESVQVVPITWRLRAREWDNSKSKYGDSAFYCKDLGPDRTEYEAFLKKARPKTMTVAEGVEFLVYVPEKNVFCTYFIKNTQGDAIAPLSAFKGRLATITAEAKDGKRGTWYLNHVRLENRTLSFSQLTIAGVTLERDIVVDPDTLQKSVELFLKPMTITTDDTAEDLNN